MALRSSTSYAVQFPKVPTGSFNFYFSALMPDGTYQFTFNFMSLNPDGNDQKHWYFTCITPSGEVRWGMVNPNSTCWSAYPDVGVVFVTSLSNIGQNDLSQLSMYMMYWN